jgi:16S rRNA (cytosine1402-N4)-methyltransferase
VEFEHKSVLLAETMTALITDPDGVYVDCTLGGGGHALAMSQRLNPGAWLVGIDQDPAAVEAGRTRLADAACKVSVVHGNFRQLASILEELQIPAVNGVLFDLGVSSHQLDVAERGFSYMHNGPLDMRMNPESDFSAHTVVNSYPEGKLTEIIGGYGEERWAKRIAKFIVQARSVQPIGTTAELMDIIKRAIPAAARREGPHPAKRTFQAIRIEVNAELAILRTAFTAAVDALKSGGRLCIITFHSLEDRIAKQTLQELARGCLCPRDFPICVCKNKPRLKILGKPVAPSPDELAENPRSRSAKLRVAEKV